MNKIPQDLKYTESHEWVRDEGDGTVTIGITDYAQHSLGDLVFVELPEVETSFETGDECGVVESVKAASDIYSPVNGEVVEVNELLLDAPETLNDDPYMDGWIFKLQLTDVTDMDELMSADDYSEFVEAGEH